MASVDEQRRGLVLSLVTFNEHVRARPSTSEHVRARPSTSEHVRARQSCVRDAAPWLAEWPA